MLGSLVAQVASLVLGHERLKAYVCVLYDSQCTPVASVALVARGDRGDITGNVTGEGFTRPSSCSQVQGPTVLRRLTSVVPGATDSRGSMR